MVVGEIGLKVVKGLLDDGEAFLGRSKTYVSSQSGSKTSPHEIVNTLEVPEECMDCPSQILDGGRRISEIQSCPLDSVRASRP